MEIIDFLATFPLAETKMMSIFASLKFDKRKYHLNNSILTN